MQKRKKKIKIKKSGIIIIILIVLVLFLYNPIKSIFQISNKGYDLSTSYKIYKDGIKDIVLKNDYSKTLDYVINSDYYDEKEIDNYFKIKYFEYDEFLKNINIWLSLGYKYTDINSINEKNDNELNEFVSKKYVSDIVSYLDYDFFKVNNFDRYLDYFNGDYKDTIVKVNIGLDKKFFEDPNVIKDYSIDMIINKYNKLDNDFVPPNLTELDNCSEKGEYLTKEAKEAYDSLCFDSKKAGFSFGVTSSYRSYDEQLKIYNSYLKSNGQDYVDKYVATPGFSEHQTGLALDIKSLKGSPFKYTNEYKWMIENSYKYGFILRYPENLESITGYNPEAWHFRYVGKEIASFLKENNLTYEEYYAMYK